MRNVLCILCGFCIFAAGCGGRGSGGAASPTDRAKTAIDEVGELYRVYQTTNNKPPQRFEDLKSLGDVGPVAVRAIKSGEIVVRYGASMADTNEGASTTRSDEVLAYEKQVPTSGGNVLMLDRTTKTMTADEFKAAKKAGKE